MKSVAEGQARPILAGVLVSIIAMSGLGYYLYQNGYFSPSANYTATGVNAQGCFIDANGRNFGCTNARTTPIGQDVVSSGGQPIYGIAITKAPVSLNYTGTPTSWSLSGSEVVQLDKGLNASYPISMSGQGGLAKTFNVTLPKMKWTASELQTLWDMNYGLKKSNITLKGISISISFSNGVTLTKPASHDYVLAWLMNYIKSSSSSSSSTSSSSSSGGTNSGTISGGRQDTWTTTVSSATGGNTGNLASNGIIMTIAPYSYQPIYAVIWVYLPSSQASRLYYVNLVTKTSSYGTGSVQMGSNAWTQISLPAGVSAGDLVIGILQSSSGQVFKQAITVSPAVSSNQSNCGGLIGQQINPTCHYSDIPPPPYDAQYYAWFNGPSGPAYIIPYTSTTASSTFNPALYGCNPGQSAKACASPLSVVSVTF